MINRSNSISKLDAGVSLSLGASTTDEVSDENDDDKGGKASSDDNWDDVAGTGIQIADFVDLVGWEGGSIDLGKGDDIGGLDVNGASSNESELGGGALVGVGLSGGNISGSLLVSHELSENWDLFSSLGLKSVVDDLEGFVAGGSEDEVELPLLWITG